MDTKREIDQLIRRWQDDNGVQLSADIREDLLERLHIALKSFKKQDNSLTTVGFNDIDPTLPVISDEKKKQLHDIFDRDGLEPV
jgi:hypothetical protein